jgi:hypothetical protein
VGIGRQLRIREDKWLPRNKELSKLFPRAKIDKEAGVEVLIGWNSNEWHPNRLRELFDVGMVKAICQIPIGSMTSSDVPIWNATTYKWRGHC